MFKFQTFESEVLFRVSTFLAEFVKYLIEFDKVN